MSKKSQKQNTTTNKSIINIIFEYDEYENHVISDHKRINVSYKYKKKTDTFLVKYDGQEVEVDAEDDESGCEIAQILPEELDIGCPMSALESTIFGTLQGGNEINRKKLDGAIFKINEDVPTITLTNGKIVTFPNTGSAYMSFSIL